MHTFNKDIGNLGEDLSCKYLRTNNYIIMKRNFRCKIGEIDIIARNGDYIVFVEVKSRFNYDYGTPAEAVNLHKQRKICKTAEVYIMQNNLYKVSYRFDVIEILFQLELNTYSLKLIKDAFQPW